MQFNKFIFFFVLSTTVFALSNGEINSDVSNFAKNAHIVKRNSEDADDVKRSSEDSYLVTRNSEDADIVKRSSKYEDFFKRSSEDPDVVKRNSKVTKVSRLSILCFRTDEIVVEELCHGVNFCYFVSYPITIRVCVQ